MAESNEDLQDYLTAAAFLITQGEDDEKGGGECEMRDKIEYHNCKFGDTRTFRYRANIDLLEQNVAIMISFYVSLWFI